MMHLLQMANDLNFCWEMIAIYCGRNQGISPTSDLVSSEFGMPVIALCGGAARWFGRSLFPNNAFMLTSYVMYSSYDVDFAISIVLLFFSHTSASRCTSRADALRRLAQMALHLE